MYREVAKLILYRDLGENSILRKLAGIFSSIPGGFPADPDCVFCNAEKHGNRTDLWWCEGLG